MAQAPRRWDSEVSRQCRTLIENVNNAFDNCRPTKPLEKGAIAELSNLLFGDSDIDKALLIRKILESKWGDCILTQILIDDSGCFNKGKLEAMELIEKDLHLNELPIKKMGIFYYFYRLRGYIVQSQTQIFQRKSNLPCSYDTPNPYSRLDSHHFKDSDVLHRSKVEKDKFFPDCRIIICKSENKKYVVQQTTRENNTEACAAMLLFDNGKGVNLQRLARGDLFYNKDDNTYLKEVFDKKSLISIEGEVSGNDSTVFLNSLRKSVLENGPCVAMLNDKFICDYIAKDLQSMRIRCPWHGWEITIAAKAFLEKCYNSRMRSYSLNIFQVKG